MRRAHLIALGLCLPFLAGCVASDLDFDLRPDRISTRGAGVAAPRPAPDANGLLTYESYQVVVARRGDTVAGVAARIGVDADELARFNGRQTTDVLRADEILALPRRVTPGGTAAPGGRDIAAIASGAIDAAEARQTPAAAPLAVQDGAEPVRHRVARGETAYSVARLYSVSVRSLAEWNGLGPDLAVREGQFLIIPLVIEEAPQAARTAPGTTVAPLPPSSATPLPAPIQQGTPPASGTQTAAPAAAPAPAPTPPPAAAPTARFIMPVSGSIIRPYGRGNEGIDIGAATGTPVRAAGDGEVAAITRDTDQIPILVVRHSDGLLTVYANIRNISVARGDRVTQGQTLAEVGPGDPSFLHFEVRRGFEAVNPTQYLP
ncbi:peptidoglycan DD-metalloendopeptidase family protein [Roseicyclus mahoneyensis]|uniref:Murein DD-endopeptidase MepM/ murein hydrolase activator NlpD n=1 Tax=Roseicyclus mahoneyensis TaxID=164332 RepID=A0A316GM49_9RHOB|nr:peptidoglycan DD-metalloendopeptidase family protein [Roseicyclus mahoneyensis]PWK60999.1 murein DD-endopeptidase MepM/ murein hydrolase activator NlpD [Roseicyclus mahoneyensis]